MKNYVFAAVAAAGFMMAAPAMAGDAAAGEKVFRKCKACHYVDQEKNKTGPHLVNIVGRKAGAVEGYKYSKAMAGSDLVWDEATLAGFLAKPKSYLKGTKMAFAGLKKDSDIADVIAYLKSPN
jgi:cytochrome c